MQELSFEEYYKPGEQENQRVLFLRNCTHIHNKAIFDCLNENLDFQRIFSIWGKPFSWKKSPLFSHERSLPLLQECLKRSEEETVRSATFSCGIMADKEESLVKDVMHQEMYLQQIMDDRMSKLL